MTAKPLTTIGYDEHRFLIADDRSFVRSLINSMLLRAGARQISQVASGKEAIEHLEKAGGGVDCVISDWNMQPINGLELLQKVRAGLVRHTSPELCFLLLTGAADAALVNAAIALDVHAYVVKPVSYDKLVKAIGSARERKIALRSPKAYLAVAGLETPADIKTEVQRQAPWMLWMAKSPRRRQWEERLTAARDESKHVSEAAPSKRDFGDTKRLLISNIAAGSVLAEDIFGAEGRLLIAAGTILGEGVLARLRELSDASGEEMKLLVGIQK